MTMEAIAEGGADDLLDVFAVMQSAFDPRFGETWTPAQFAGALALPGTRLFLARQGGVVAGFALVRAVIDTAEVLMIGVRRSAQRSGIGSQLLAYVIEAMKEQSVAFIHIEVRSDNPAIEFYRRFDFVRVGIRRDYYRGLDGKWRDALTFRRQIG